MPAKGVAPVYSLSRVAGQDVNSYAITVTAEAESNPNYTVTVEDGIFSITPAAITIKADNKTKVYDNDETTDPELTATATGVPAKGVVPVYNLSRVAGQDVDEYAITVTAEAASNPNYTVTVEGGTFKITPAAITIKADDKTKVYDNDEATDPALTATATGVPAKGVAPVYGLSRVEGQDVNEYAITVTAGENPNYTVTVAGGTFTITPIDVTVTITGHHDTTIYDGTEHSVTGYDVEISNPLYKEADFIFSGNAAAARTDVGTTNMGLAAEQFANTNTNFGTVTFNVTDGYQTITPVDEVVVTITGHKDTTDYDGEAHSVAGYDVEISSPLYKTADFTFSGTSTAARTDAGTTYMGLTAEQFSNTNKNFKKVTFNVTDGYQTVNPIDVTVTITGHNNTAPYDGAEHSVAGYDVEIGNPLYKEADFTFNGTATATRTDAGTTTMGLTAGQFTNTNGNFKTVTFNVTDGYQTITPINVTVTVTGANNTTAYDGEEHGVSGYTATADSDLYDVTKDFTFSGTAAAARTNAGTTSMGLAADQFENTNANFGTVTFNVTDGYQTINPIDVTVTITGHNNTATYDGEEHTVTGYDVKISNPLYTEADFTFNGTAEAKRTENGTTNMGLAAEQFANTNGNFKTVTFNVTDGYQTITPVDEVVVTITGHNNTMDYDGEEHSVSGYDVAISNPLYTVADFTFSGTAEAARTDAGTTNMGLAAGQFANTNTNFEKVTFVVTDGYQTINPIDVTVTIVGANNTTDYDGEAHTVTGYTATANSDLYDVTKDFTFSGTAAAVRTDAGTTNMGLAAAQFTNTNPNFKTVSFNVTDGYQKINPIDVTVTIVGANNTTDYDGEAHTVTGYTATASSGLYDVAKDFTFNGTAAAARTDVGTTNMGLTAGQFTNANPNFKTVTFNVTDGYQTITPIDVTVTIVGATNTTDYDGTEHTVTGYTATASSDLYDVTKDFTFSGTAAAARTDVGTTNMGLAAGQFANTNGNFGTVTFNVTDGYQTITPIDVTVTITGHNSTVLYDGTEHSVSGYDVEISNPLYTEDDFIFSGNATAARTNAGTTSMSLAAGQFTNTNTNFGTVTFVVTDGYQTIDPIDVTVTITGHNSTMPYDGAEHSVKGYDAATSTPLYKEADFTFSGTATAARTDAGTTNMGLAADQFENTNANFGTVTFNVTDGYQTINPIDVTVTITGHSNTATYDSKEHTVTGYDVKISNPLYKEADFTFSGTASAARTDVGTTNMGLAAEQFANTNANFGTVTFNVTDGYQTITPVDEVVVTITGHNNTTDYDGKEHSVAGYDIAISNPLYKEADFTFSGNAEAARTNAGTTNMGLAAGQFTNNNGNFGKVTFVVIDGYQTITPINVTVTVTGESSSAAYNGEEHSVSGFIAKASSNLYDVTKDFTFSGNAEAKRTDAGTTYMGLEAGQFTNTNENFKTVTFVVADGYQTITPIDVTVTVTGANNTTAYDGEEHRVSGYTATASSSLYDVTKDFTFSGTAEAARTDAGTTNMGLAADQFANTNANFGTVTFVVTDGYQKINPIDVTVTITGHHNATTYDGAEHTVTGYDAAISNPLYTEADFTFNGTAEAKRTENGTTNMGLTAGQFANTNENFKTVTFNVTDGYQTITPVDEVVVTITGHNNTTDYDGEEHGVSGYDVEISNPLYMEADFTFSGTAEAARTGAGTTNMGLMAGQFANTNGNFKTVTFNVTDGYQTIDPINVTVTITGANNTTNYDGEEHGVTGYGVAISNTLYTEADFTFSGTAEAARTGAGTTNMGLAADQFANTNPNFRTVTFEVTDGYQTIRPIDVTVTITGHNSTVPYDGEEHSVTGYDVEISNPLYAEADFIFSGTAMATRTVDGTAGTAQATAARTDVGTTEMGLAADQFTNTNGNFRAVTFEVTDGYQTITPIDVTVTITEHSGETVYDGTEHTVTGYDVSIDNELYTEADFTFSGSDSASGTNVGSYPMDVTAEDFENTNGNFNKVEFVIVDGTLQITPAVFTAGQPENTIYNADTQEMPVTVTFMDGNGNTVVLREGTDYTIEYYELDGNGQKKPARDAGTVIVEIKGIGNFEGHTETREYTIARRPVTITVLNSGKTQGDPDPVFENAQLNENLRGELSGIDLRVHRTNTDVNEASENPYEDVLTIDGTKATLEAQYANYEFTILNGDFTITAPEEHKVTVTYRMGDETVATFTGTYSEGEALTIRRPIPDGYTAVIRRVNGDLVNYNGRTEGGQTVITGTMGDADAAYEVVYEAEPYELTIHFVVLGEETEPADPIIRSLKGGEDYRISINDPDIPNLGNYRFVEVTGRMPNHDAETTVWLLGPNAGDAELIIEDDRTPLGINDANLGSGEIIE